MMNIFHTLTVNNNSKKESSKKVIEDMLMQLVPLGRASGTKYKR